MVGGEAVSTSTTCNASADRAPTMEAITPKLSIKIFSSPKKGKWQLPTMETPLPKKTKSEEKTDKQAFADASEETPTSASADRASIDGFDKCGSRRLKHQPINSETSIPPKKKMKTVPVGSIKQRPRSN